MRDLSIDKMKDISGGISVWGGIGIVAGVIFVIGVIDGFVRPVSCNK